MDCGFPPAPPVATEQHAHPYRPCGPHSQLMPPQPCSQSAAALPKQLQTRSTLPQGPTHQHNTSTNLHVVSRHSAAHRCAHYGLLLRAVQHPNVLQLVLALLQPLNSELAAPDLQHESAPAGQRSCVCGDGTSESGAELAAFTGLCAGCDTRYSRRRACCKHLAGCLPGPAHPPG